MPSWLSSDQSWYAFAGVLIMVVAIVIFYFGFLKRADPKVIVYLKEDEHRPKVVVIVIENVGKGAAQNIRFTIDGDLPARAFATDDSYEPIKMAGGPLVKGLDDLEAGAKRMISWGLYDRLRRAIGDRTIGITSHYRGRSVGRWQSESMTTSSSINAKALAAAVGLD